MDSMIPQGSGVWAAIGSAIILAIGGAYKAFRMIKGDIREDRNISSLDKFVERDRLRIKELEDDIKKISDELNARIDKISAERNTAIELNGKLQGEIKGLSFRVEDMLLNRKNDFDRSKEEITALKEENLKLKAQNEKLILTGGFSKSYIDNSEKKLIGDNNG